MAPTDKPYKQAPPEDTVARLREILDDVGIETVETEHATLSFHSGRVETADLAYPMTRMGANGKGMTREYSRASAHAELFERLQNGNLAHPSHLHAASEAYYRAHPREARRREALARRAPLAQHHGDPREVVLSVAEAVARCGASLSGLLGLDDPAAQLAFLEGRLGLHEVLCAPFYEPARRAEVLIPIRLLEIRVASNGMCAGNTPTEALVQGVCELFERHAMARIFVEQPRLPEIPLELFGEAEIVRRIAALEASQGWRVTVKDCSFGMGVPVIGALIHDPARGACAFHIGVAPSPATALERCFTEIFQTGYTTRLLPIDLADDPLAEALARGDVQTISRHLRGYFRTGAVRFPLSILSAPDGATFDGAAWQEGAGDAEDLAILLRRVEAQGWRLFVRDVSFLGFPAFWIYIPGVSEADVLDLDELAGWYAFSNEHLLTWNDLAGSTDEELRAFAEAAEAYLDPGLVGRRNLGALWLHGLTSGVPGLEELLPYVWLRLGERGRALALLSRGRRRSAAGAPQAGSLATRAGAARDAVSARPPGERCLTSALALAEGGLDDEAVEARQRLHFAEDDVMAAMLWLTEPALAFHQLDLPVCFACERCSKAARCGFVGAAYINATVKARHEERPVDVAGLAGVFDGLPGESAGVARVPGGDPARVPDDPVRAPDDDPAERGR